EMRWILSNLAEGRHIRHVWSDFCSNYRKTKRPITRILHLSDLHLGHKLAAANLPRVKLALQSVINEFGQDRIIPVITGDLMHTPSAGNLQLVKNFQSYLTNDLKLEKPIIVPGNHDSRMLGFLPVQANYRISSLSHHADIFVPLEHCGVGFLRFDSNKVGPNPFALARGKIDEAELKEIGTAIDKYRASASQMKLIALVHHHPISVQKPIWHKPEWYQQIFGWFQESTGEFENSSAFLHWLQEKGIPMVLHGHKHIPHFSTQNGTIIVGCGSSTGKVKTMVDRETYMSLNIITIDGSKAIVRLRAERLHGAGLEETASYEMIMANHIVP
ncbi:MAG: metallophosphoesterase, partial [Candidatus Obscuribacter phosphatis]|nr:metallophosphoesterase [Candidatus Obscuribacter phosphatis]